MLDLLVIASVLKPQGVKGELKLECHADSPKALKSLTKVYIDDIPLKIETLRFDDTFAYLKLYGINDRDAAELLRGKIIKTERFLLPKDTYFISDIVGCNVKCNEKIIGKVSDILQNGSADVYCVEAEKPFMFPAISGVILDINVGLRLITVDADELDKVVVYED